ncbi:hypothetical protein T09_3621 [Trichinella sp. T9]|nr:hypothetical protein T09_3621 [Trichinella sp. T9]
MSHPELVKSFESTATNHEKLLLLNKYSLKKGVIITALR